MAERAYGKIVFAPVAIATVAKVTIIRLNLRLLLENPVTMNW
jgi:hypothetical protein